LVGANALEQTLIDQELIRIDGTDNKANLGANATLGVSLAIAKSSRKFRRHATLRYVGGVSASILPVPMMNILNGGNMPKMVSTSRNSWSSQLVPLIFSEALRLGTEVYHALKAVLKKKSLATGLVTKVDLRPLEIE